MIGQRTHPPTRACFPFDILNEPVRTLTQAKKLACDERGSSFLLIIIPIIPLFFVVFGTLGGLVARRTRSPIAAGIGLGLILA